MKRSRVLRPHVRRHLADGGRIEDLKVNAANGTVLAEKEKQPEAGNDTVVAAGQRRLLSLSSSDDWDFDSRPPSLLDAYGESLLFVDRLLSAEYGHARREVPAHIPHFVDKAVLGDLREKFPQVGRTSTMLFVVVHSYVAGLDISPKSSVSVFVTLIV